MKAIFVKSIDGRLTVVKMGTHLMIRVLDTDTTEIYLLTDPSEITHFSSETHGSIEVPLNTTVEDIFSKIDET